MDKEEAKQLIIESLKILIQRDLGIINNKVKEECINHRLACYLEKLINENPNNNLHYDVDLEYNKNYKNPKKIIVDENNNEKAIRPDIIIHKRDSNDNLIAFEIKKDYTNKNDFQKIKGLVRQHNYSYGCLISYLPGKDYMRVKFLSNNPQKIIEVKFSVQKC
jgi:hypothetical protein